MRHNILTRNSTKQERIVYEILKELKIPFKHRWLIGYREIDFVIGKTCIEIDGHEQDGTKNAELVKLGYTPIHLHNSEVSREKIIKLLKNYERN